MKPKAEIHALIETATFAIADAFRAVSDDGDRSELALHVLNLFAAASDQLCDAACALDIGYVPAPQRRLSPEFEAVAEKIIAGVRELLSQPQQTVTIVDQLRTAKLSPESARTVRQIIAEGEAFRKEVAQEQRVTTKALRIYGTRKTDGLQLLLQDDPITEADLALLYRYEKLEAVIEDVTPSGGAR